MTAHPAPVLAGREPDTPSSAAKVLGVLRTMLEGGRGAVGLSEIALAGGLPRSTAHRLLKELEGQGFVERFGSLYRLGADFLDLAQEAWVAPFAALRDAAYPSLATLFEQSEAVAVHLAVLRGSSIHYVDKLMRPEGLRLPTRVGGRFPAACTGLGKAMLATGPEEVLQTVLAQPLPRATPYSVTGAGHLLTQLDRVRTDGFVVEREEACHGFVCVAAPVGPVGRPIAAISVAVPTVSLRRAGPTRLPALGRLVVAAARRATAALPVDEPEVPAVGTVHSLPRRSRIDSLTSGPTSSKE